MEPGDPPAPSQAPFFEKSSRTIFQLCPERLYAGALPPVPHRGGKEPEFWGSSGPSGIQGTVPDGRPRRRPSRPPGRPWRWSRSPGRPGLLPIPSFEKSSRTIFQLLPARIYVPARAGARVQCEARTGAQGRTNWSVAPGSFLELHRTRTKPARALHAHTVRPGWVLRVGPFGLSPRGPSWCSTKHGPGGACRTARPGWVLRVGPLGLSPRGPSWCSTKHGPNRRVPCMSTL